MSDRFDERALNTSVPTRRTVVRSAAWAIPAVAAVSAAPAFAATPGACTTYSVAAFPFASGGIVSGSSSRQWSGAYAASGAPAVTLTGAAVYTGQMENGSLNFTTVANAGGLGGNGLLMYQRRTQSGNRTASDHYGTYTFQFSRPVRNLTFSITDIDYSATSSLLGTTRQYDDRVSVTSPGATVTVLGRGGQISSTGDGTSFSSGFRPLGTQSLDPTDGRGNVRVRLSGDVTQFTVRYWNAFANVNHNDPVQGVFLNGLSYDYEVCTG